MGHLKTKAIMSQAWRETSLKVQRPEAEAKGIKAYASNASKRTPQPINNRLMIWPGLNGDVKKKDKKPSRYYYSSLKSNRSDIVADTEFSTWFNKRASENLAA